MKLLCKAVKISWVSGESCLYLVGLVDRSSFCARENKENTYEVLVMDWLGYACSKRGISLSSLRLGCNINKYVE